MMRLRRSEQVAAEILLGTRSGPGHPRFSCAGELEVIAHPHLFQRAFEQFPRGRRTQMLLSSIATEGHEMEVARLLIADQIEWHSGILNPTHVSETKLGAPVPKEFGFGPSALCLGNASDIGQFRLQLRS